jgi:hypothetical protein
MGRLANGARGAKCGRTSDRRRALVPSQGREPPYARSFPMHRDMQPRNLGGALARTIHRSNAIAFRALGFASVGCACDALDHPSLFVRAYLYKLSKSKEIFRNKASRRTLAPSKGTSLVHRQRHRWSCFGSPLEVRPRLGQVLANLATSRGRLDRRGASSQSVFVLRPSRATVARASDSAPWAMSRSRAAGSPLFVLRALRSLRALVLLLVVPLALSWSLPALARVVAGPPAHVCHCDMRHGHSACACPKCFPDREDLGFSEDALRGQCGDDFEALRDPRWFDVFAPSAPFVFAPALVTPLPQIHPPHLRSEAPKPPPRKPPKTGRTARVV